jgi:hypothetical protein
MKDVEISALSHPISVPILAHAHITDLAPNPTREVISQVYPKYLSSPQSPLSFCFVIVQLLQFYFAGTIYPHVR